MEMFLVLAALSLIGIAVSAVLFSTAIDYSEAREREQTPVATSPPIAMPQFFVSDDAIAARELSAEALLLQIARHVQLEQAAAESFLHAPTSASLHSRTVSTLVH
jgi:hypothetical protein